MRHITINLTVGNISSFNISEFSLSEENTLIYPNPFKNLIKIRTGNKIESIKIMDIYGKVFLSKTGDYSLVDLSDLPNGVYWLSINQSEKILTKKIIKQH